MRGRRDEALKLKFFEAKAIRIWCTWWSIAQLRELRLNRANRWGVKLVAGGWAPPVKAPHSCWLHDLHFNYCSCKDYAFWSASFELPTYCLSAILILTGLAAFVA